MTENESCTYIATVKDGRIRNIGIDSPSESICSDVSLPSTPATNCIRAESSTRPIAYACVEGEAEHSIVKCMLREV
jgi:hypothetical protein